MFRNIFKRNKPILLQNFLINLRDGKKSVLKSLDLANKHFEEAGQDDIYNNADDLECGVNRIQKKFDSIFFGVFENMLIKHYDNEEVKFIFYTKTNDSNKIIEISDLLFREFGSGLYDDRKHTPFSQKEKIYSLAQGKYLTNRDEMVHLWISNNYSIVLQYRIEPMRQFVLSISEKPKKEIEVSIRRKGTILNFLNLNLFDHVFCY